jgi:DNA helicase-2/ATP-dependent DNA helicase PcrA
MITSAQKSAAGHKSGHSLVLAGPGTGKTTTLIERCRLLLRAGVPLDALFITTFTKKAAIEIKNRLKATMESENGVNTIDRDEVLNSAHIDTFHSLCARILKRFPMDIGLPYDFEIIGESGQRKILYGMGIEWDDEDGSYVDYISRWKDMGISPSTAMAEADKIGDKFSKGAALAYEKYEVECKAKSYVDFSDLISLATKILKANKEGAKWFHGRFSHFIVDEFQDTNAAQIEFIKSAIGRYGMLWAVGDEDQSLYEWRGSTPEYCLNFKKIFKPSVIYNLSESFRCSPQIIKMSSKLIEHNVGRYDKKIKPARKSVKGEAVMFKAFQNDELEAEWIANNLKNYMNKGGALNKVSILFRTGVTATTIQRHLEIKNIPFRLVGLKSFWNLREVNLFVLGVAAINDDRRFDIFNGFGDTEVGSHTRRLSKEMKGTSLREFAHPLARVLYDKRPNNIDADRRASWMSTVESVLNILLEMDDHKSFLDLALERQSEEASRNVEDQVYMSTLHSAKGLEWEMVFLTGAEDDQLPHFKSNNIEEERRLFYVGMTRSKHQLFVTYARKRHDRVRTPSRFLKESALPDKENLSFFKWSETKNAPNDEIEEAEKKGSRTPSNASKNYRKRGGKSLIPPDETNF